MSSLWSRVRAWWSGHKARYEQLVEEYGSVAVVTYLVLFLGTWFGFWVAISRGLDPAGSAASAGTVGGAYVATKLTQPARILATLALTPLVVRAWRRVRGSPA